MRCFNHIEQNAIGVCAACYKGLCVECLTDLGYGLACKNNHEQRVKDLNFIISKNIQIYNAAPRSTKMTPLLYAFMGIMFLCYGVFVLKGLVNFSSIMGFAFIVYSSGLLSYNNKIFGKDNNSNEIDDGDVDQL